MNDNFPNMPSDSQLPDIGLGDSNNTAQSNLPGESAMVGSGGKTKVNTSDASGPSYAGTQGYGFNVNDPSTEIQGGAPGNGSGVITDNNGQGNSSGIPAAQPIPIMTFGDPNDTGLDFRDGLNPDSVTIQGGGKGDIKRYGFDSPAS